jgi:hypothetical protein
MGPGAAYQAIRWTGLTWRIDPTPGRSVSRGKIAFPTYSAGGGPASARSCRLLSVR